ncbi:LOW QUALITY PROTEIN: hypothetical protein PAHAL_5G429400 [Panicum hallii]|uniref:Uncharacterized protein n=1 Tax=Panicum hallii TaxID=206008 RepID=A0A2T8IN31_9POAL|nr:LOW QUALITY PROTEIN: hypothetical protein PAHAL_5G429400 [Panicum hallii]
MRCSEETVAGDGSMCAARHQEKKRPRKADKPSKKEKRSEEKKKKRSKKKKKRIEKFASKLGKQAAGEQEKRTKKPTMGDEVMREMEDDSAAGGGMTKLSQELLDYLRTKEVMGLLATEAPLPLWAFDLDQRLKEEIAAEFQEKREFDAHVLYQYRTYGYAYAEIIKGTETEAKNKTMKLVTQEINNQAEMGHYLSNEVWSYVMSIGVSTFEQAVTREMDTFDDLATEGRRLASRIRHIENQANLLRQYRTNGHAVLQYQVTDDERDDVEEV